MVHLPSSLVTKEELNATVKKMATRNTVLGPDGVSPAAHLPWQALGEKLRHIFNKCLSSERISAY